MNLPLKNESFNKGRFFYQNMKQKREQKKNTK